MDYLNGALQKLTKLAHKSGSGTILCADGTVDMHEIFEEFSDATTGAISDDWILFPFVWAVDDLRHRTPEYQQLSGDVVGTGPDGTSLSRADGNDDEDWSPPEEDDKGGADVDHHDLGGSKKRRRTAYDKLKPVLGNDGIVVPVPAKKGRGRTAKALTAEWEKYDRACAEEVERQENGTPAPPQRALPPPSSAQDLGALNLFTFSYTNTTISLSAVCTTVLAY